MIPAMFENLTERLSNALRNVRGQARLTEDNIKDALREVRMALLEADVALPVVRDFISHVRERAIGQEVTASMTPGQALVKIVRDELIEMMGSESEGLKLNVTPPAVILMAGLQGSGKTTACAKLARHLSDGGKRQIALAACDVYRPAAIEQLVTMGKRAGATVYERGTDVDPVEIADWALKRAKDEGKDVLIIDTAGRLHLDQELMEELGRIRKKTRPHNVLLVVDAMTGQDAVGVAEAFAETAEFDGILMTKLDGDARGGAALSVRAVTGKPVIYASTGEKIEDLERFHPDRMAGRILGMGDVLSLIEKAEEQVSEDEAEVLRQKMLKSQFTLEDFLTQMRQVRKMGPLGNLIGMMPGMGKLKSQLPTDVDESELDRVEAIILSMTPEERANPEMIKGSRRKRIAAGSGTKIQQVNHLVKQFDQMRRLMKQVAGGKMPDPQQIAAQMGQRPKVRYQRR